MARPTKRVLQSAVILLLTAGLLWMFFRGADAASIWSAATRARPAWVLAAVSATMLTYVLRALRWQILLAPLGHARLANCFSTTVIGFMVNFLVPTGRMGEIARPYLLARRERLSASGAFATIFLERLLDLVTVTLLIGFQLLAGDLPRAAAGIGNGNGIDGGSGSPISGLEAGGALGLAVAVSGLASLYFAARYPDTAVGWAGGLIRFLPEKIASRVLGFIGTFVSGLRVLLDGKRLVAALALSVALWTSVALGFWLGARALDVLFDYPHTFLVIGFLTVGVAAPTPGGIGGYHYMGALALTTLFGVDASTARATVLVNHAIAFLPVTLLGIVLFLRAGLSLKSLDDKENR